MAPGVCVQFSRLRLTGFKSFVDPTDLVISDGLTGVVGPNGCGKSNLLEALRWVMGENRPTAMRGDGMEDVIFAGVASRPARNFAEVVLHLDNSDRLAPAAFNDADHLEIVRRVTRDVGSAYKVNAKDVRARDVQMLFADASTGAHSPALVRQGQISELINAKPKARRRVLEEAAGISGLYQRRHEAELKLRAAETNLARVDDVVEQLASQLAQLARQAKQAARYRQIGEDLRQADRPFVVVDIADEEIRELRDDRHLHVQGNAEDEETLMKAGIDRARGLILALPEDSSNVFVALTARELNPELFILARTVDHDNRSKLLNAGVDKVIAPSEVGADRMAQVVLRPNVDEFMEQVLHTGALSLQIDEVKVHPSAPLAGQTLAESNFRQQFEAIVIGIIDAETESMTFNPSPTERIQAGDILIVLGDSAPIEILREKICTP